MEHDIIICDCKSPEHQIIVTYFPEDPKENVYISIHLTQRRNIWKRMILAIKYVFGYKSRYGHFDEIILTKDHLPQFRNIVDVLESN